jgi:4-hydroxy-2-oxoheptanedioate aldolase
MNRLKQLWSEGKTVVNGWLNIPSGFTAELMSQAGWDSVTVDLQHGLHDYMSMIQCFQAMQASPITPMVRIPANETSIIGKALDGGAYGLICPLVNTKEDAEAFVAACRYTPKGVRSFGPTRVSMYVPPGSYPKTANDDILCIPMVETPQGIENLEAILDVPGVDGIYLGPSDLAFCLGLGPGLDREEEQFWKIYERMIRETNKRGIAAAIHCATTSYAIRAVRAGFKMVTIMNDSSLMLTAARSVVQEVRKGIGPAA